VHVVEGTPTNDAGIVHEVLCPSGETSLSYAIGEQRTDGSGSLVALDLGYHVKPVLGSDGRPLGYQYVASASGGSSNTHFSVTCATTS
jgi:hypothetical protein